MKLAIQLFVPNFRVDECLNEIRECLEKGWTGLGFKTVAFEEAWKQYTGLPHAHFLSSNTVGLHLALHMMKTRYGWGGDAEVITTPLTFVSTNHAILQAGLKPVFADIDQYLCLDPEDVERRITAKTVAVIFVGIGGNTGQYDRVRDLCHARGIKLVLDAAHMAGTRIGGKHVGHDADVTVFSFQAVKNLATADSGMICFADADDDVRVRKLAWLGINKDTYSRTTSQGTYKWMYEVEELGFKYHGNSIMASIGLVSLRYLDRDNSYRRQLAEWYEQALREIEHVQIVPVANGCESSRHLFQIRTAKRDELMLALHANDIFPGVHYRDNTEYNLYAEGSGNCPQSAKASSEILSLPMHMGVTFADVQAIAAVVRQFAQKAWQ